MSNLLLKLTIWCNLSRQEQVIHNKEPPATTKLSKKDTTQKRIVIARNNYHCASYEEKDTLLKISITLYSHGCLSTLTWTGLQCLLYVPQRASRGSYVPNLGLKFSNMKSHSTLEEIDRELREFCILDTYQLIQFSIPFHLGGYQLRCTQIFHYSYSGQHILFNSFAHLIIYELLHFILFSSLCHISLEILNPSPKALNLLSLIKHTYQIDLILAFPQPSIHRVVFFRKQNSSCNSTCQIHHALIDIYIQ